MNYGQGGIQRTNKANPSGAPFPLDAANNGLSVDPVSKRIVLGNDFLGTAAQLLSTRYIPTDIFGIELIDWATFNFILLQPDNSSLITLNVPATAGNAQIGADAAEWDGGNAGSSIGINASFANPKIQINNGTPANHRILEFSIGVNTPIFQMRSTQTLLDIVNGNGNLYFSLLKLGVGYNGTRIAIDDPAQTFTVFAVNGLKVTGDTTLIHSGTALANGAGAAAGTLLNAPAAGNPTKWIRIDDNGTNRFIPAW